MTMSEALIRRLRAWLTAGDLALVAAYVAYMAAGVDSVTVRRMLDLNGEGTIPAWYTSAQLLLAGMAFLHASANGPRGSGRATPPFLAALGAGFCFLSADEVVGIHETITVLLRSSAWAPRFGGDHGIWIPLYVAIGVVFVAATARQWLRLRASDPRGTAWLVAGALVFLAGAAGVEILGYGDGGGVVRRAWYTLQVSSEEGLELLGATAMLVGALLLARARPDPSPERGGGEPGGGD